ncbi:MAG: alpha-amylase/4-alpha-glucanotransferase domain-containing protein [Candidatus Brocadiales bacterium]
MGKVHFVFVLHNHQPVGNFDGIFKIGCSKAYEPFVRLLGRHPEVPVVLHYSGSLLEWIEARRPELFERIKILVNRGQIELLGSGFYEPILGMLPEIDCVGQVREYGDWLNSRFGTRARGLWLTERFWEQTLVKTLKKAGVEYTVVDDSHFKHAGLAESELYGYFLTNNRGKKLGVFPCSERLRYLIPFKRVEETIEYLRRAADTCKDAVVVYADDGEKFGLWPNTFRRVYRDGWLEDFFGALHENRDWIRPTTLGRVVDNVKPRGEVSLPNVSYREMMGWAVPARDVPSNRGVSKDSKRSSQNDLAARFTKGGSWRNFLTKYPEANQMYLRMLEVSKEVSSNKNARSKKVVRARRELYKGQCNDAYWHGMFGGLYLPHLRAAVYRHLLAAEAMTDSRRGVCLETHDYDLDGTDEFKATGPKLNAYFRPSRGGHLYELDYRPKCVNLMNTLTSREEAYHRKLRHKKKPAREEGAKSIHKLTQKIKKGVGKELVYDRYQKEGLIDHMFAPGTRLGDFVKGKAAELGDFVTSPYRSSMKRSGGKMTLRMSRTGILKTDGKELPLTVTKIVEPVSSPPSLHIRYLLENLSDDEMEFTFGVEFNLSMSAGRAPGRYYLSEDGTSVGNLAMKGCLSSQSELTVVDEGVGLMVSFGLSPDADVWVCPVETVSQSESGLEKVYQCSTVLPNWGLTLEPGGKWEAEIKKHITETRPV